MEQRYPDNLVIGHYKGMAIVENEFGTLFYIEDMDEGMAPAGTVVEDGLMESIQNLREVDRDAILRAFGGREERWQESLQMNRKRIGKSK